MGCGMEVGRALTARNTAPAGRGRQRRGGGNGRGERRCSRWGVGPTAFDRLNQIKKIIFFKL